MLDDLDRVEVSRAARRLIDNAVPEQTFPVRKAYSSPRISSVYVVARNVTVRSAMARLVELAGYRVVPLAEVRDLIDSQAEEGIVVVHESADQGSATMCAALLEKDLWLPVIGFGNEVDARRVIDGMKAGAIDFLVGPATDVELAVLLQECERKAKVLFDRYHRRVTARRQLSKLSKREREVLDLVASGLSSKEAAKELELSHRTVEIHRLRVLSKLGAQTAAHAVSIASAAAI